MPRRFQVLVNRLSGLLSQFKLHGLPSFLLTHRCALYRIAIGSHIIDLESDDIATAQLAVDG